MLKTYKKIEYNIFGAQKLIEFLVVEIFCKANAENCFDKLKSNDALEKLYLNPRSSWFKDSIESIYKECKDIDNDDRNNLKKVFFNNNKIEYLCSRPNKLLPILLIKKEVAELIVPFFKELYDKFLTWKDVFTTYGTKKEYYNDLIEANDFKYCPCCGYGQIKNIFNKGHSAYDHYFPIKYYPFSVVNFYNLFPLCNECNSDNKSDLDILKAKKRIFYPFGIYPEVLISMGFGEEILSKFFHKKNVEIKEITQEELALNLQRGDDYLEEMDSWNVIFDIRKRYYDEVRNFGISWVDRVKKRYNKDKNFKSYPEIIDSIIDEDKEEHYGFLRVPFLENMKSYTSIQEAMDEVSGSHRINVNKPIS